MISSSMALPGQQGRPPSRSRVLAAHMARHREQAARDRQQWELHARNWKEMNVRTEKQVAWSSTHSYQKSMSAYQRRSQEEEKKARLEERRNRLRAMLQEEDQRYEAELKEFTADRRAPEGWRPQEREAICFAAEDRKHAGAVRKDCWGENNLDVQKGESALHKDPVISQRQEQISERKKRDEAEQKEKPLDKGCERTQGPPLDWMTMVEERKEGEEQSREEELRKRMRELKLREEEATHLRKEQEALQLKQEELEQIADERRAVEQKRKASEVGQFLQRHYGAQLKRRAQQVRNELEFDRNILARLLSEEPDDGGTPTERRQLAVADAAWMKLVIEKQLQLEREREVEFDAVHRDEAQWVWERRQAQWEKEAKAREKLMHEVLKERRRQLKLKMQKNHEAQVESLREREELIQRLELEREARCQKREREEQRVATPAQEAEWRQEQMEEEEQEEEVDDGEADQVQDEEELRLEMQRVSKNGYQERIPSRARSAWT